MQTFRIGCGLFLFVGASWAQQYVISTVAGGAPPPTPAAPLTASIGSPSAVAADNAGNVYFVSLQSVFKLAKNGLLSRVAGNSRTGYSGDGGPATAAQLSTNFAGPNGVAVDGSGNIFVADSGRIRKVATNGIITTVAGGGSSYPGDGGPATVAKLYSIVAVAVDGSGNLFIADVTNFEIRKVSTNGIITTVAGNGSFGFSGDGGTATSAQLGEPQGLAIDGSGDIFIADAYNNRIRKVSANGIISTVAGNGISGFSGDGGPATSAELHGPNGVAVDVSGNLFIADPGNNRIREVSASGIISTVAGNGIFGFSGDGGPATSAELSSPNAVAIDVAGNLFIAIDGGYNFIRKVSANGVITTLAGNGTPGFSGDGGPATAAQLAIPWGVFADTSGNLFIADSDNARIRKVASSGIISTVAGNGIPGFSGDGGSATIASLGEPQGLAADGLGNLFIAVGDRVRKVSTSGVISTVAGNGLEGFSGDGGPGTSAQLNNAESVVIDGSGNLFIADTSNNRVRKVSTNGIIITVAGSGAAGFSGDGGLATTAQLNYPTGLAIDASGNVFIADLSNNRIREVSARGIISTVAGNGTNGFSGDGGVATSAQLSEPYGVAIDGSGDIFIADTGNGRVRKVSSTGIITTVAGGGTAGYYGDGGPATSASLAPQSVTVDGSGNLFVADAKGGNLFVEASHNAVRQLTPTSQSVLIGAVVDAASEFTAPVSPGKIVVIYGGGLGPSQGVTATPSNGAFGTQLSGTTVSVNGVAAPVYYTSATQVNAIVPYEISGATAGITVAYQGGISSAFSVPIAASAPSFFTLNSTGAGQAAAVNVVDGTINTAANPVKIGAYISFYATGEGQTAPAGVDGKLGSLPLPSPNLSVTATVGGIPAVVQYKGGVFGTVAGLMQVNVQIPPGVQPGGYVPVVLQVGSASTVNGAVWISVSGN